MVAMRVHELHPMLIHAPLVLLPAAAAAEIMSVASSSRMRRAVYGAVSRRLWWGTVASGLAAGVSGMAASQEVEADEHASEMMLVHGLGNVGLVVAALGLATWRSSHPASLATASLAAGALIAGTYTAWLGGEMVYGHGVGVKPDELDLDARRSPRLLSPQAPVALVRDALRGLAWLLRRGTSAIVHRDLHAEAINPLSSIPSEAQAPTTH